MTEDNTFVDNRSTSKSNANSAEGGNVMNDYLQAHVSSTTQGINNHNINSNNND